MASSSSERVIEALEEQYQASKRQHEAISHNLRIVQDRLDAQRYASAQDHAIKRDTKERDLLAAQVAELEYHMEDISARLYPQMADRKELPRRKVFGRRVVLDELDPYTRHAVDVMTAAGELIDLMKDEEGNFQCVLSEDQQTLSLMAVEELSDGDVLLNILASDMSRAMEPYNVTVTVESESYMDSGDLRARLMVNSAKHYDAMCTYIYYALQQHLLPTERFEHVEWSDMWHFYGRLTFALMRLKVYTDQQALDFTVPNTYYHWDAANEPDPPTLSRLTVFYSHLVAIRPITDTISEDTDLSVDYGPSFLHRWTKFLGSPISDRERLQLVEYMEQRIDDVTAHNIHVQKDQLPDALRARNYLYWRAPWMPQCGSTLWHGTRDHALLDELESTGKVSFRTNTFFSTDAPMSMFYAGDSMLGLQLVRDLPDPMVNISMEHWMTGMASTVQWPSFNVHEVLYIVWQEMFGYPGAMFTADADLVNKLWGTGMVVHMAQAHGSATDVMPSGLEIILCHPSRYVQPVRDHAYQGLVDEYYLGTNHGLLWQVSTRMLTDGAWGYPIERWAVRVYDMHLKFHCLFADKAQQRALLPRPTQRLHLRDIESHCFTFDAASLLEHGRPTMFNQATHLRQVGDQTPVAVYDVDELDRYLREVLLSYAPQLLATLDNPMSQVRFQLAAASRRIVRNLRENTERLLLTERDYVWLIRHFEQITDDNTLHAVRFHNRLAYAVPPVGLRLLNDPITSAPPDELTTLTTRWDPVKKPTKSHGLFDVSEFPLFTKLGCKAVSLLVSDSTDKGYRGDPLTVIDFSWLSRAIVLRGRNLDGTERLDDPTDILAAFKGPRSEYYGDYYDSCLNQLLHYLLRRVEAHEQALEAEAANEVPQSPSYSPVSPGYSQMHEQDPGSPQYVDSEPANVGFLLSGQDVQNAVVLPQQYQVRIRTLYPELPDDVELLYVNPQRKARQQPGALGKYRGKQAIFLQSLIDGPPISLLDRILKGDNPWFRHTMLARVARHQVKRMKLQHTTVKADNSTTAYRVLELPNKQRVANLLESLSKLVRDMLSMLSAERIAEVWPQLQSIYAQWKSTLWRSQSIDPSSMSNTRALLSTAFSKLLYYALVEDAPNGTYLGITRHSKHEIGLVMRHTASVEDQLVNLDAMLVVALHEFSHVLTGSTRDPATGRRIAHGDQFYQNLQVLMMLTDRLGLLPQKYADLLSNARKLNAVARQTHRLSSLDQVSTLEKLTGLESDDDTDEVISDDSEDSGKRPADAAQPEPKRVAEPRPSWVLEDQDGSLYYLDELNNRVTYTPGMQRPAPMQLDPRPPAIVVTPPAVRPAQVLPYVEPMARTLLQIIGITQREIKAVGGTKDMYALYDQWLALHQSDQQFVVWWYQLVPREASAAAARGDSPAEAARKTASNALAVFKPHHQAIAAWRATRALPDLTRNSGQLKDVKGINPKSTVELAVLARLGVTNEPELREALHRAGSPDALRRQIAAQGQIKELDVLIAALSN